MGKQTSYGGNVRASERKRDVHVVGLGARPEEAQCTSDLREEFRCRKVEGIEKGT